MTIPPGRDAPLIKRLIDRTKKNAKGCLIWTSSKTNKRHAYGLFSVLIDGKVRTEYAHRWMWEILHGPIPKNHIIYHTCREKLCINPDHLLCVTRAEQTRLYGRVPKCDRRCHIDGCTAIPPQLQTKYCPKHHAQVRSMLAKKMAQEFKGNYKSVIITLSNGTQKQYSSCKLASKAFGVSYTTLARSKIPNQPTFKLRKQNVVKVEFGKRKYG